MKNKFQKTNWRRISALFAVVMVMCSVFVFSVPVSAVETGYDEVLQPWLHDTSPDVNTLVTFILPEPGTYNLRCNARLGNNLLSVDSVRFTNSVFVNYSFYYNNEFKTSQAGYPLVSDVDFEFSDPFIKQTARYLYSSDYQFVDVIDQFLTATAIYVIDNEPTVGTISSVKNNGQFEVTFSYGDVNSVLLYSGGTWLRDSFRTPLLIAPSDRTTFQILNQLRYVPSPFDQFTFGLRAVISWIETVLTAIVSGPLSPLAGVAVVGVAVSALLLIVYIIRRFIWGA